LPAWTICVPERTGKERINRRTYTPLREEIGAEPHEVHYFSEDLM